MDKKFNTKEAADFLGIDRSFFSMHYTHLLVSISWADGQRRFYKKSDLELVAKIIYEKPTHREKQQALREYFSGVKK
jgi:hypothetical protein